MFKRKNTENKIYCSFCGKDNQNVKLLIAAENNVHICGECIDLCSDIKDRSTRVYKVEGAIVISNKLGSVTIDQPDLKSVYRQIGRILERVDNERKG